jgi:hypothetical protein
MTIPQQLTHHENAVRVAAAAVDAARAAGNKAAEVEAVKVLETADGNRRAFIRWARRVQWDTSHLGSPRRFGDPL